MTAEIGSQEWYQMMVVGLRQVKTHLQSPRTPDWKGKDDIVRWIEAMLKGKRAVLVDRRQHSRRKADSTDGLLTLEEAREIVLAQLAEEEARKAAPEGEPPTPVGIKARFVIDDADTDGC